MKHSFFLVIPKQETNPQRLREFDEKILGQWIAELPIANPLLASRLVYDYITELNRIKMPVQLRLDTLEQLRPSFLAIEEYLRSRLVKTDFPKEESDKKTLRFLVTLEQELTISYWIALKELSRQSGWFQGKNTSLSLQRCLKGLSEIVHSHMLMGMAVPDWVWMDLHSLYKLAVKLKKHNTQVSTLDDINPGKKTRSPAETYSEIILLALADGKGLMQREIKLAYSLIQTMGHLLEFDDQPIPGQSARCQILSSEDKPPIFATTSAILSDKDVLYVDFSAIYFALDELKTRINPEESRFSALSLSGGSSEKWTVDLLDYLKQRWQGIPLQSAPLFEDRLDRYVSIGLNSTFKLLYPDKKIEHDEHEPVSEFLAQSVSGRLLSGVFSTPGQVSIGNLISFRKTDAPVEKRSLGIIDTLMVEKEPGKLSFGVQLLAQNIVAINYYSKRMGDSKDLFKKALLYQVKSKESKSFFITDTFILKNGDIISLFIDHEEISVTLNNKKNIGLGYWQFECAKSTTQEKSV